MRSYILDSDADTCVLLALASLRLRGDPERAVLTLNLHLIRTPGTGAIVAAYDPELKEHQLYMIEPSGVNFRFYGCALGKVSRLQRDVGNGVDGGESEDVPPPQAAPPPPPSPRAVATTMTAMTTHNGFAGKAGSQDRDREAGLEHADMQAGAQRGGAHHPHAPR